ncbi:hypothetical protein ZHAS_00012742 [Anopheles sinensis]|uniref:Uncharacterized protein n=1 Tax=Anopheles sinensis TaxID=74873 RepID=A0A084W3N7_ANOSI|nr:hypothetical protein ZHAS_00012742 [Anopheles sinensis]
MRGLASHLARWLTELQAAGGPPGEVRGFRPSCQVFKANGGWIAPLSDDWAQSDSPRRSSRKKNPL